MSNEKDSLVDVQEHPRDAKPGDFSAPKGSGPHGMAEGKDQLVSQSESQEGPRNVEDSGDMTPSVWGKGGKQFSVGQAGDGSSSVSIGESVDLAHGDIECKGYTKTVRKEVAQADVSIPS